MRFFTNKKVLFKLIVALCICLTIMNFGMAPISKAESKVAAIGGTLLNPIVDLLLGLGDAIMNILQKQIMGIDAAITIDTTTGILVTILSVIVGIIVAALVIAAVAAFATILPAILGFVAAGLTSGVATMVIAGVSIMASYNVISGACLPDVTVLPTYHISPEEIFRGEIVLFGVNVFNPKEVYVDISLKDSDGNVIDQKDQILLTEWNKKKSDGTYANADRNNGYEVERYYYFKDGNTSNTSDDNIILTSVNNSAYELKNVISRWYYTIRNIAIVVLMLVLLYIGIRILLGTVASEKAKYKQMLADWLVAMCLIFLMQYIMVFANTLVDKITIMLSSVSDKQGHYELISDAPDKLINKVEELGYNKDIDGDGSPDVIKGKDICWNTNLMGKMRLEAQEQNGDSAFIGYGICFAALVIMTLAFIFTYLKRLLYMMFLTIIAPFVAMTYPLDKINDGQAQAFNMWLKEYIFNLLIQPFHLLLYTILISMAFDLSGTNIIYSLVAIGFMMPAEKFLRNMFGFNKASTPGFLDGAAGAAMTIAGIKSLANFASKGSKGNKDGNNSSNKDNNKPKEISDRGANSGMSTENLYSSLADEEGLEDNNNQQLNGGQDNTEETNEEEERKRKALEQYYAEGYKQNTNGEYFNPWLDEYDPDYDPTKDASYAEQQESQPNPPIIEQPQPRATEQQESEKQKLKFSKRKYAKARLKNGVRNIANEFRLKNLTKNAGNALNSAAALGLGATGAAIGISAGIASGSLKDASQYAAGGAFAGSTIGKGVSARIVSGTSNSVNTAKGKHEEALQEMYGSEYSQYLKEQADEKFMKDPDIRKMYQREFDLKSKKDIDAVMESAKEYRKYGITDDKVIMKAMKLQTSNPHDRADKEKIAAAKLATTSKSLKDLETNMKRFSSTPGMKKATAERMERYVKQINNL